MKQNKIASIVCFCIGFLLYANTIPFDYALDDKIVIINNEFTKKGIDGIDEIMSNDAMVGFFGKQKNLVAGGRYRPFTLVTHAIEWELFGKNPHISHFINALLYGFSGLILFLLLLKLFPPNEQQKWFYGIAFLITAIWLANPLHTEVVANIKSRDEILSTLFAFWAFYYAIVFYKNASLKRLVVASVLMFISLMCKESSIAFLAVIPAAGYYFKLAKNKQLLFSFGGLLIAAIIYLIIRYQVIGSAQIDIAKELMNNPFLYAKGMEKWATIFMCLLIYLKLLIFPHPLTHDYYPWHPLTDNAFKWGKVFPYSSISDPEVLFSILIFIALIVISILELRKKSVLGFGLFLFFSTFILYTNIIFPIGAFMNERFLFQPTLGIAIIVVYYLHSFYSRKNNLKPILGILGLVFILYSFKTIERNYAWENDNSLALTDVKTSTGSAKVNMSAGLTLIAESRDIENQQLKAQKLNEARSYLQTSINLYPGYIQPMILLGNSYAEEKDYENALIYYDACLKMNPQHPDVHTNLEYIGDASSKDGKYQISAKAYELLLSVLPNNLRILSKVGEVYGKNLQNVDMAIGYLERAYSLNNSDTDILQKLGVAYAIKGRTQDAIKLFEEALKVDPENARIIMNLGLAYQSIGEIAYGQELIEKSFQLEPELRN